MQEFKSYHPIVSFTYFAAVLGLSMFLLNPVMLGISLVTGLVFSAMLMGRSGFKTSLHMLPFVLAVAVLNPLFNHQGMTILTYLPSGNPLTLESILFGIASGVMLMSVLCHFACFNQVMTSDKLMCLFGNIIPSLSLLFSMVLRFVPRFKAQLTEVRNAQQCLGRDLSQGSISDKVRNGVKILSIMITWSLENGIDTADSMKSRGFGLPHRTSYSNFRMTRRDVAVLLYISALILYIIAGIGAKAVNFRYFPGVKGAETTIYQISVFTAYLMLFLCPVIIELKEAVRWKRLKSKI